MTIPRRRGSSISKHAMSESLALKQGASWLQTTSANLWTFYKHNISLEDTFSVFNSAE
jgi:hypothetical protein